MSPESVVTVLNTPCLLTSREELVATLAERCRRPRALEPLSVDFTNVHIVALRSVDTRFFAETSNVDWFVSDSQVLSWAISLLGGRRHSRVYGPDFMSYFFRNGDTSLSHFFLGGSAECLDLLETNLRTQQPDLKLSGTRNGYFTEDEEAEILEQINAANPDVLWVGLGTPKQQQWIHRNKGRLRAGVILAVGFAFDVNAGTKKDAPAWLGPIGCTWIYRLGSEPRRLWRRYLVYNSIFLYRLFIQVFSGKPQPKPA